MVFGPQVELAADPFELRCLGLLQGAARALEDPAGVGHRMVEKELVEAVSEVVVVRDVPAAAGLRVAAQGVDQAKDGAGQDRGSAFHPLQGLRVPGEDPHHGDQIVGRPVPVHVGGAGPDAPAEQRPPVESPVPDRDGRGKIGLVAEGARMFPVGDGERPLPDVRKGPEQERPRKTVRQFVFRRCGLHRPDARRVVHMPTSQGFSWRDERRRAPVSAGGEGPASRSPRRPSRT